MIKSWVFEFFSTPHELTEHFDPVASQRYFNAYLDLWESAEPVGFEGIFFSEHHFGASYSPSPNLLVASVARRTKKIRLGVLGVVPPYHSPWQLVEEIGMLDHLTDGRLEIGTAAGIPQELAQVGLTVDEARARYDEAMEILDKALSQAVISHRGRFWNFDNLRLTPRPIQQPHPPKWVTVVSESSARKAARRGARISTAFHPQSKVMEIFDAYRDEAAKVGREAGPDDFFFVFAARSLWKRTRKFWQSGDRLFTNSSSSIRELICRVARRRLIPLQRTALLSATKNSSLARLAKSPSRLLPNVKAPAPDISPPYLIGTRRRCSLWIGTAISAR